MSDDYEALQRGKEFLDFVSQNQQELRKALKKNITYNPTLFDDVFQNTIVKVYTSIVKNNKEVKDYKQYFFISLKWEYVLWHNRHKKELESRIGDSDYFNRVDLPEPDDTDQEDRERNAEILECVKEILSDEFGEDNTILFLDYMYRKNQLSFQKIAREYGRETDETAQTIRKMKRFFNDSKLIQTLRQFYKNGIR